MHGSQTCGLGNKHGMGIVFGIQILVLDHMIKAQQGTAVRPWAPTLQPLQDCVLLLSSQQKGGDFRFTFQLTNCSLGTIRLFRTSDTW